MKTLRTSSFFVELYEANVAKILSSGQPSLTFTTVSSQVGRLLSNRDSLHVTMLRERNKRRYYLKDAVVETLSQLTGNHASDYTRADDYTLSASRSEIIRYAISALEHIEFTGRIELGLSGFTNVKK